MGLFAASPLHVLATSAGLLLLRLPLHWRDEVGSVLEMPVAFGDRSAVTIWGMCWVFPRMFGDGACCKKPGSSTNTVKTLSFQRAGMGKKKPRFACGKKVFPRSNIYAMRGTAVGIAHPFVGQFLQGKQSAVRLPRALITVVLAAWGNAPVLKR